MERLEVRAEEQSVELRYALRRLNRVLAERGPASTASGADRAEARGASPPVVEPSYAPQARRSEPEREASWESVRSAAAESASGVAAATATTPAGGDDGDGGFRLPFDLGGLPSGEWWLNKVGIALLLFGVAFLFKFSWDQGWLQALLTPWVRVGVGLATGGVLTVAGFRVAGERRGFAQVLFGGGIGVSTSPGSRRFRFSISCRTRSRSLS